MRPDVLGELSADGTQTTAHVEIPLADGRVALVDIDDYAAVSQHRWHANDQPTTTYALAHRPGTDTAVIRMHHLVAGTPDGMDIDHANGDGLDNRRTNLRAGTRSQNMGNARRYRTNTSGYKGVSWRSDRGTWRAYIRVNYTRRYLGEYSDPWDAAQAYNAAAVEAWGEFAQLNERAA